MHDFNQQNVKLTSGYRHNMFRNATSTAISCSAVQSLNAVSAYFSSEQILPFGFAKQCWLAAHADSNNRRWIAKNSEENKSTPENRPRGQYKIKFIKAGTSHAIQTDTSVSKNSDLTIVENRSFATCVANWKGIGWKCVGCSCLVYESCVK